MIIVMKQNAPLTAVENLETELNNRGFKVSRSQGESKVVLGLIGDTFKLDERDFLGNEWVEKSNESTGTIQACKSFFPSAEFHY